MHKTGRDRTEMKERGSERERLQNVFVEVKSEDIYGGKRQTDQV